jgi:16S rRNA processing protein RimM
MPMEEYLEIGQIVNTNGLKGTLKVKPLTDDITRFEDLETIYIQKHKELVEFTIQEVKYSKNMVLLKLEGIDDINDLLQYKGQRIFVAKQEALKKLEIFAL